ncbi:MAG TPA: hypothetical protein GXX20_03870 [Clostridiaceae bacterium]|nr:hypothetical protein [Clostridiaceae bacterium]
MKIKELKVVNLNITEDYYEYKALFRLCSNEHCMDIDLSELSEPEVLENIKRTFVIEEDVHTIKETIMEKVMEASKIESRVKEGKDCCYNEDTIKNNYIDSLSKS